MEWISVEDDLPKNREQVLVLIEGFFPNISDPLFKKKSYRVFQSSFTRSIGWETPYAPELHLVKYWMKKPEDPVSQ